MQLVSTIFIMYQNITYLQGKRVRILGKGCRDTLKSVKTHSDSFLSFCGPRIIEEAVMLWNHTCVKCTRFLKCLRNVTCHINFLQVDNLNTNKLEAKFEAPWRNANTRCVKIRILPNQKICKSFLTAWPIIRPLGQNGTKGAVYIPSGEN
jgi:hypothetical protein